jgi:hypothetical protein
MPLRLQHFGGRALPLTGAASAHLCVRVVHVRVRVLSAQLCSVWGCPFSIASGPWCMRNGAALPLRPLRDTSVALAEQAKQRCLSAWHTPCCVRRTCCDMHVAQAVVGGRACVRA